MRTTQKLYAIMTIGATVGMGAAFWQTLEKLTLLKNNNATLSCNLSPVFSCTNVLNAPQSAVFGFPNSLMCLVLFTIFFTVGLAGLCGSQMPSRFLKAIEGLSVATLGFAFWFLFQSTYRIGAICIFCLFCFAGLLAVNASLFRINTSADQLTSKRIRLIRSSGADIFFWCLCAVSVAASIVFRFYA